MQITFEQLEFIWGETTNDDTIEIIEVPQYGFGYVKFIVNGDEGQVYVVNPNGELV